MNAVPVPPERAERIIMAVLANMDNWRERLEEIEEHAIAVTGNKGRALALLRDMQMAKISLRRLAGLEPD